MHGSVYCVVTCGDGLVPQLENESPKTSMLRKECHEEE